MTRNRIWPLTRVAALVLVSLATALTWTAPAAALGSLAQTETRHRLPVSRTTPTDGTVGVRPDAPIEIGFDRHDHLFRQFRQQLESGHFGVWLDGSRVDATYDKDKAVIRVAHPLLERYAAHTVELRVKAALHAPHARVAEAFTYAFHFTTGSALHEPTHASFDLSSPVARVGDEGAALRVQVWDDYGLPGAGATVATSLEESGVRVPSSANAPGGPLNGGTTLAVTDTEAEDVTLTVYVRGPYADGRDDHAFTTVVRFLPGRPAAATIRAGGDHIAPGEPVRLEVDLVDRYGNPTPGVPVTFASSNDTARFDPVQATTDANGTAVTSLTAARGTVDIVLSGDGFRLGQDALTGQETLSVQDPPIARTKHLRLSGVTRGWVHWPNVYDTVFTFDAAPGEVTIQQLSVTSNACWGIYAPDGAVVMTGCLTTGYSAVPSIPLVHGTLPAAGTYTLKIHWGGQYGNIYDMDVAYPAY